MKIFRENYLWHMRFLFIHHMIAFDVRGGRDLAQHLRSRCFVTQDRAAFQLQNNFQNLNKTNNKKNSEGDRFYLILLQLLGKM